jgi:hypothetical protein
MRVCHMLYSYQVISLQREHYTTRPFLLLQEGPHFLLILVFQNEDRC